MAGGSKPEQQVEARQLIALAESKFKKSKLKSALKFANRAHRLCPSLDGLSDFITCLRILHAAAKSPADWYEILQVQPFSHINTINTQYKKLALVLHPDKNSPLGSEDAFKLVGEAFEFLSDRVRRKEYDAELRLRLQSVEAERDGKDSGARVSSGSEGSSEKLGNVGSGGGDDDDDDDDDDDNDDKLVTYLGSKGKIVNGALCGNKLRIARSTKDVDGQINNGESGHVGKEAGDSEWSGGRLRRGASSVGASVKKAKIGDEMMTLAEMQLEVKRKVQREKMKIQEKTKEKGESSGASEKIRNSSIESGEALRKCRNLGNKEPAGSSERTDIKIERSGDVDGMAVEDSDFYDFDKDRVEKSFKEGQVWAVYDDDDGMPRLYGLIDEVISVHPFEVRMSWLDLQNNGDNGFVGVKKIGLHVSSGVYKVSRKTSVDSLNVYSHIMACERAAKEVYRIYPTKGSVWALYVDGDLDGGGRNVSCGDNRRYDIGVILTSYNENYGLSMAYLEKVDGFKTVFRRREIGSHAIRWFESDDVLLFSHQIPARKLSGEEVPDHLKDCWELDPASLPSDMLTTVDSHR